MLTKKKKKRAKVAKKRTKKGNVFGRNSKFTVARRKKILKLIRAGNFKKVAAVSSGIGKSTYDIWIQHGSKPGDDYAEFRAFKEDVDQAYAQAETDAVQAIKKAIITGETRDSFEWLARARYKNWGKRSQHEVTGPDGAELFDPSSILKKLQAMLDEDG